MNRMYHNNRYNRRRAGFTLLEVLLSVAIATGLMVAVNFFVLSMGELWGRGSEERLFDQHVRGVTRFLESFLSQAVVPSSSTGTDTQSKTGLGNRMGWTPRLVPLAAAPAAGFGERLLAAFPAAAEPGLILAQLGAAGHPSGFTLLAATTTGTTTKKTSGTSTSGGTSSADTSTTERFAFGLPYGYEGAPPMLVFEVDQAPGVCVWSRRPLPQVVCALEVTADDGLALLWQSRLEADYGTARPRKTQLSPFVQSLKYEYYDADKQVWSRVDQPLAGVGGVLQLPQRLRLVFAYRSLHREVSVALPGPLGGAPLR